MKEFIKKYYIYIAVVVIVLISVVLSLDFEKEPNIIVPITENEQVVNKSYIYIDIKGSVLNPGVYKVEAGTRLFQLINLSGGFTEEADHAVVNQSVLLYDEMYIYIPNISEDYTGNIYVNNENSNGVVNLNTASKSTLETLPGIGPSTAQSIIDYRDNISSFNSIEDIMNVPGIGEATFNEIKTLITV
ncbi:ComE operon protein 1 [Candidatus Izimaplasma bacterium HR1]|jgi:competence protein ComEA|uniref:helix-hairpin-helix domain-containing protein n=1 Tax=Candidatus Izimoplasma sp. HR1 TaxID=1541959 RepID=UPI0004F65173|nr:ComE operon protein 1 [Candidatus Izimaplasma bacterium HR1]